MGMLLAAAPLMAGVADAATQSVSIQNISFMPAQLTVNVGDTVTWTNNETTSTYHTVSGSAFDSSPSCVTSTGVGCLQPGQHFSHTFTSAGTFDYHCKVHASMTGTVVVQAAAPASSSPATTAPHTTSPPTTSAATTAPHTSSPVATGPPTTARPATTGPNVTAVAAVASPTSTTRPSSTAASSAPGAAATGVTSPPAGPSGTLQVGAPIKHRGSGSTALGIGLGVAALAAAGGLVTVVRRRRS
jgi:plastocyanin